MAEWIDLSTLQVPTEVLNWVPPSIAHEHLVLPVRREEKGLVLAVSDPEDAEFTDLMRFVINQEVEFVGASLAQLKYAIWRCYGPKH